MDLSVWGYGFKQKNATVIIWGYGSGVWIYHDPVWISEKDKRNICEPMTGSDDSRITCKTNPAIYLFIYTL